MEVSQTDRDELRVLEESLWKTETRFDRAYMESILAPDFFEFGRSGKRYTRDEILDMKAEEIRVELPHQDFQVHAVGKGTFLVTYMSKVTYDELEVANRSSLWQKTKDGWKLQFHQGTAVSQQYLN